MARLPVCLVAVLVASCPAGALAAPTVTVAYLSPAPDITAGTTWYTAHKLLDFDATYAVGDNEVALYGVWDANALYLAAEVTDQALYATAVPNDSGLTWENDTIELLFDPTLKGGATITQGDTAFRQYIFNIAGSLFDATGCCASAAPAWNGTAQFTVTLHGTLNGSGTGYLIEMRVPWVDLDVTPHDGLEIGFDVANDDRDDFNVGSPVIEADWLGLVGTFAQPNQWGRLKLAGGPAAGDGGTADGGSGGDGGGGGGDGGGGGGGGGTIPTPDDTCGCRAAPATAAAGLLPLLVLAARRRRR
jgi:hypothetical protein